MLDVMINDVAYVGMNISSGQPLQGPDVAPLHFQTFLTDHFFQWQDKNVSFFNGCSSENQNLIPKQNRRILTREDLTENFLKPYAEAFERSKQAYQTGKFVVHVGGDHSVAVSSIAGFTNSYPDGVVIWIDAHADMNVPESSTTGNFHGMPLSILLNVGNIAKNFCPWLKHSLAPENLIFVGLRDIDPFEIHLLEKLNIKYFSAQNVKQLGIESIVESIQAHVKGRPLHISLDVDGLDPQFAPSTGLQIPDGLSIEDVCVLASWAHRHNLKSLDLVEMNPALGSLQDVQRTFESAAQILFSSLGHQSNLIRADEQTNDFMSKTTNSMRRQHDWTHRSNQNFNSNAFEWRSEV